MNTDLTFEVSAVQAMLALRQTIARLTMENDQLYRENARLKREAGKARLLADLRRETASLDTPALLRRQAE